MILNMAASAFQRCTIRSLFSTILLLLNLKYANPLHANGILMTTGDSAVSISLVASPLKLT